MPISSTLRSQIDGIKTAVDTLRTTADKESDARKEAKNPAGSPNEWTSCRDELLKYLGKHV